LDIEGMEALFATSMRDFRERRDGAQARRGAARRSGPAGGQARGVA